MVQTAAAVTVGVLVTLFALSRRVHVEHPRSAARPQLGQLAETMKTVSAYSGRLQDGMQKFNDATAAIEDGDLQAAYDAWRDGKELMIDIAPVHVGVASLQLARLIDERYPEQLFTAWIAAGAVSGFEKAQRWTRAAEAAHVAAGFFHAAGYSRSAAEQEYCATQYAKEQPC